MGFRPAADEFYSVGSVLPHCARFNQKFRLKPKELSRLCLSLDSGIRLSSKATAKAV